MVVRSLGSGVAFTGPADAAVLAAPDELAGALGAYDAEVIVAPGPIAAAVGFEDALEAYIAGEPGVVVVDDGDVFGFVRDAGDAICIAKRWVHAGTGQPLLVALVTPDAPAPAIPTVAGYRGAVDAGALRVVAPEIVQLPFWTPAYCRDVVDAAESLGAWSHDSDDPVPGDEISLVSISPRLFARVESDLAERVVPQLRAQWSEFAWCGLHDAFVIRYAASSARGALALHHDIAQISGTVRLNDGYFGGATEFPRQRYDTAGAPVGSLTMWPSLVTHPHRGAPVTRGVKYGLTIWFALPD